MKIKKLIPFALCAAAALVFGQLVRAQGPDDNEAGPPHHHGPPNLTEMLTRTLDLTDTQKTQVQTYVATAQPQLEAIHQQARTQADAVLKQLDTQIRPLLSAEQAKKLDAIETLRAAHVGGPGPE